MPVRFWDRDVDQHDRTNPHRGHAAWDPENAPDPEQYDPRCRPARPTTSSTPPVTNCSRARTSTPRSGRRRSATPAAPFFTISRVVPRAPRAPSPPPSGRPGPPPSRRRSPVAVTTGLPEPTRRDIRMAHKNDTGTGLRKRVYLHSSEFRAQHQSAKAFLAPQRDRKPKIQHPKPQAA